MGKKAASEIMLVLLTIGILSLAFNIQPAKSEWTGTVYIRADGSIDPPDAPIITYDNITYTLIDNITSSREGIVVERDNIVVDGMGYVVQGTNTPDSNGIHLSGRKNVIIKNMEIRAFWTGIYIAESSNIDIVGNNLINNNNGIGLLFSSHNSIVKNNITDNDYGISIIDSSNNNSVFGNSIIDNDCGIWLAAEISHFGSSHNIISRNNITNNYNGIWLAYSSNYNSISGNNITANKRYGICLDHSSNNRVYHNNLIDNGVQASPYESYNNLWDDGYPSGGNYWSDYTGVDFFSGPYQNEAGSDGIGDTSYNIIDENNVDRYPLIAPFNSFNTSIGYSVDVISNSTIEDFRYFESNGTIIMHVSNMTVDQAFGFCRITIPHEVISSPYIVKVNGTEVEYETIYENSTEGISIIYFAYEHSRLEIMVIPEFPSATTLTLLMLTTSTATILLKKKRKTKPQQIPKFPHTAQYADES